MTYANQCQIALEFEIAEALLHKSGFERTSPFPRRTYPTGSVIGMPSRCARFDQSVRRLLLQLFHLPYCREITFEQDFLR